MPGDNILDHPDLQALDELERREAEKALTDPDARDRLTLRTLLALRAEQKAARAHCRDECKPEIKTEIAAVARRVGRVEGFRWWMVGLGAGVMGIGVVAAAVNALVQWLAGGKP